MNLPQPKTNTQEVLYHLITYGHVSIMDFPYLSGFRTRISELRKRLFLYSITKNGKNKFGNSYKYRQHYIAPVSQDIAVKVYNKMIENNNKYYG